VAFFVAVIDKIAPVPTKSNPAPSIRNTTPITTKSSDNKEEEQRESLGKTNRENQIGDFMDDNDAEKVLVPPTEKTGKKKKVSSYVEAPFLELSSNWNDELACIRNFYGFSDNFPFNQLMARSETSPQVYFISSSSREILAAQRRNVVKVVNTGLKLLTKKEYKGTDKNYRICSEGVPYIAPYLSKRKLTFPPEMFLQLLKNTNGLPFDSFGEGLASSLKEMDQGSVLIESDITTDAETGRILVPIWRGKNTVRMFLSKQELAAYQLLLCA